MNVRSINIAREGDYGFGHFNATKPFKAKIKVGSESGEIELFLSEDLSRKVVALIADEIAAAGRATAEAMVAEIFTVQALAAPGGA